MWQLVENATGKNIRWQEYWKMVEDEDFRTIGSAKNKYSCQSIFLPFSGSDGWERRDVRLAMARIVSEVASHFANDPDPWQRRESNRPAQISNAPRTSSPAPSQ
jgi:hypothetical protein